MKRSMIMAVTSVAMSAVAAAPALASSIHGGPECALMAYWSRMWGAARAERCRVGRCEGDEHTAVR